MAALGAAGLVGLYLEFYLESGWRGFVDYAGYFTNLSNLLFILVNLGLGLLPVATVRSAWFVALRGTATVGMIITGIAYAALLSDTASLFTNPWINHVIHGLMPTLALIDWLVFPPGPRRLRGRDALSWLAFALVWLGYTMTRGALIGWYPYPFIDPAVLGGGTVAVVILVLALVMLAVAQALAFYQRWRCRRAARQPR